MMKIKTIQDLQRRKKELRQQEVRHREGVQRILDKLNSFNPGNVIINSLTSHFPKMGSSISREGVSQVFTSGKAVLAAIPTSFIIRNIIQVLPINKRLKFFLKFLPVISTAILPVFINNRQDGTDSHVKRKH